MKRIALLLVFLVSPCLVADPVPPPRLIARPATTVVESSLATGNNQIRQFAFDGDPNTYFASEKNATKADHFTLTFDTPANAKSIRVTTGLPKGGSTLDAGVLEASADGKEFVELAKFAEGKAE